jgi:asparagine synthase (glutamine-hydrolysing)
MFVISQPMQVTIDTSHGWQSVNHEGHVVHTIGDQDTVSRVKAYLAGLAPATAVDPKAIGALLREQNGFFAAIIERGDDVVAFVDACRSYPVFCDIGEGGAVTNAARTRRPVEKPGQQSGRIDKTALLEFTLSGFITGQQTLYRDLQQLQAGELLVWRRGEAAPKTERYYRYLPESIRIDSKEVLIDELGGVLDTIIARTIKKADGAPIWVPLSGGLDSRLLLCKLVEAGYDRIQSFSYGPPGNHEAKIARHVAETLSVPWFFQPLKRTDMRAFMAQVPWQGYQAFADGLCGVPNPHDFHPLSMVRARGLLPDDALVVNGQSGDFITGGHVPDCLIDGNPNLQTMLDWIVNKHFAFWRGLHSKDNVATLQAKILELLDLTAGSDIPQERLIALYEYWEWQERQSKFVVNGQRVYDFMGLKWDLPLWDFPLVKFYQDIPIPLKHRQGLYRDYLNVYDYKGLFKDFNPYVWRWPGASIAVVPLARAIGLALGAGAKQRFYRRARYFGHYRNMYAIVGFWEYLQHADEIQNPFSFFTRQWLEDNLPLENPLAER